MSDYWRNIARDSILETRRRQAAALSADDRDPAAVRRSNNIAQAVGQPPSVVDADPAGFQQEVDHLKARTVLEVLPGLAQFTENPRDAAAIKDDLPNAAAISRAFDFAPKRPLITSWRDNLAASRTPLPGVGTTSISGPASPEMHPATPFNIAKGIGASVIGAIPEGIFGAIDMATGIPDRVAGTHVRDAFRQSDYYARAKQQFADVNKATNVQFDALGKVGGFDINPGQWSYSAATSLGQLGSALLTGNPVAAFGVTAGGQFFEQASDRGADTMEATRNAIAYGGIEAGTEALGLGWMLGKFGKKAAGKFIGGLLLREIPGEEVATAGENFIDAMTTGGVGWDQYKKDLPQALLDTAMSTALTVGGIGGIHAVYSRLHPAARAQEDVAQAVAGAHFLDRLMDSAAASKLRKEDPGTLRKFVEQHAENSPVRNVYFPVQDVVEYMQGEDYKGEFDQFKDQIDEAQATQDSVAIPIADAAAHLSGTPAWEALKENARATPGGYSLKEAQAKSEELFQDLEKQGAALADEAKAKGVEQGAIDEAFEDIKNTFLATGSVPANVAEATARIAAARYAVRGAENGQTPLEAWKAAKISVLGADEATGEVQGRMMAQLTEQHLPDNIIAPISSALMEAAANPDTGEVRVPMSDTEIAALREHGIEVSDTGLLDAVNAEKLLAERTRRVKGGKALAQPTELAQEETPLAGLPSRIKVDGQEHVFGPHAPARNIARAIAAVRGTTHNAPQTYARVDVERAKRIADAFEAMAHNPNDPEVKASYKAMIAETIEQYKALMETGLKVEFIEGADPYGNPRNAILDVVHNNHLWVYPTDSGFGSSDADVSDNPLLKIVPGIKISGKPVRANDLFRVVHDYFGHIMEGVGFRADGEENAWRIHSAMYSPLARRAMTTETRGQNSWVNFGPHGEANRTAGPGETVYADQKIGLLPEWVSEEGATEQTLDQSAAVGGYEGLSAFLNDDEKAKLRDKMKAKILAIAETLPDAEEMAAVALAGRAKRGWYENSAQAILDVFGAADAPRFAALLAALSPQTSVESNLYNALKTWTNWNAAGRPTERTAIVKVMGDSVQGGKGVGSILNSWINNSVTALQSDNPAAIKLSGPKVDSFMNNLVGVVDEVTNDAWMANYSNIDQVLFARNNTGGKGPGYKAMNAVTRAAADILTQKTGELWTPAEVQETVWSFAKTLYERRDQKGETRDMKALLAAGHVTHDDIANTPDFAVLFADGVYRTILEEAGYGEATQSLGRNRRAVGVDGQESIAALPEGSGFSEDAYRQFLGQAADRLESVRSKRRGVAEDAQQELFQVAPQQDAIPEAGWTANRIAGLIDLFEREDGSTNAIAVMMSPDEFLGINASALGRAIIGERVNTLAEYGDGLDVERLQRSDPISLTISLGGEPSNVQRAMGVDHLPGMVQGHAGRHRMTMLKQAGVAQVPVVVVLVKNGRDFTVTEPFDIASFIGNRSRSDQTANGDRTGSISQGVPISRKYEEQLAAMGGQILFQSSEDVFYSALARAVEQSKTAKASGQQWAATLRKTPGVRQEELEWTGLLEFLEGTEGPITKDQITALLDKGGVQIEEVMLGGEPPKDMPYEFERQEDGTWSAINPSTGDTMDGYDSRAEAAEAVEAFGPVPVEDTQFKSWSSDPSNDSYRELLITLPPGLPGNPSRAPSTHWDTEGVVAHARFMDKTDADGKRVLFIEEVQSDWHQKGRDQGYGTAAPAEEVARAKAAFDAATKTRADAATAIEAEARRLLVLQRVKGNDDAWLNDMETNLDAVVWQVRANAQREIIHMLGGDNAVLESYDRATLRASEAGQAVANVTGGTGIPNAPFKSSWPALVMKRMIRYAAENGYDRIAWTTGEEQAGRYSLEKHIGRVTLTTSSGGIGKADMGPFTSGLLRAYDPSGREIHQKFVYSAEDMYDIVGKELADKLVAQEPTATRGAGMNGAQRTLEGLDLKTGGEGMRAFYDRNLVNITNDIIKKHGAKVGPVAVADKIKPDETKTKRLGRIGAALAAARIDGAAPTSRIERLEQMLKDVTAEPDIPSTPHPGFDITDSLKNAALQGQPLFQEKRGSVVLANDGQRIIRLFGKADFSTLIHELGHVWLEEARADALAPGATDARKADWAATKRWFKANGHNVGDTGTIPVGAHELWARGTERFVMEGKAPSAYLVEVFTKFRGWLTRIYQVVENLNSPITPEIRDVFSRLIATQEEIDAQRAIEKTEPLFKTAEEAGMTEAAFADYQARVGEARDEAYNTLLYKTMEAIRRKRKGEMRDQRANIKAEAAAQINSDPLFRALHLLRTGRWLGDPERPKQDVKLNTGWLIDTFGEDILDKLPKGMPISRGDGISGDEIAEMVGARSGQELVHGLVGLRAASEQLRASGETRSLREKLIDEETDKQMADRHGDTLTDGSIEEEAIAALNTAGQGEIISAEIRQLGKRTSIPGRVTPYQFVRAWAKRKVSAGFVKDVASRGAIQRYTRAASKAARAAEEAILKGDADEAYRQKQAQLLNHALLAESKAAADRVEVIVARMKRLGGRAAMKSVDQDYMDKVHALLENYDFRPRSQKSIDEQEGFQKWMEAQRAQGYEVHIPPRLENNGDPYTRVTVEELEALNDVVESLLHLGKTKQSIITARKERDFAEWRDEAVARIALLPDRKLPDKPINEKERRGAGLASELVKVETLVEELDGGNTGPLNDLLVVGATDAENKRGELRQRVLKPIVDLYKSLGRKQWQRLQEKVTLELTWNTLNEGDPRQGQPVVVTRMELLSMALNMGNVSNLEKMSKGERWPVATLQAIMQRELTKEDWDFVQSLWTQVELLWPEIVKSERAMSGVVPEKVVNNPIDTAFGTYEGGYWPVVYDASRWQRAEDLEGAKVDDMFGLKSGVATQKGHTIERTAAFGPLSYSLENILFSHVEQVVTRIAYAPFARDVLRAIRDGRIRGMIDTKLGPEYRKQIEPWLSRQIHEGAVHAKAARWWQRVLRQFRVNMTIAGMGFRLSTGVAQTLGLTASAQRIGARWVGTGMKRMAQNPRAAAQFVWDRSPEMLARTDTFSREQAELSQNLRGEHGWLTTAQHWAMWHIGMMDRYVVAMPTWLGAHARGMSEGLTDKEASDYADKAVRQSQGSGREKDLAAIQSPNNDAMRFFTMFYTPFNVMFNEQWKGVRGVKKGDIRPMIGVTFWWLMVSTLGDALLSGDWPEDGDDDGQMDWAGWFARNVGFGLFAGIPIARDIAAYEERKVSGQYASFGTPIDRVVDAIDRASQIATKAIDDGELPSRPLKTGGDLAAIFTGLPISQPATTGQFAWDYAAGESDPQSISDWYFGITKGKVPDKE